MNLSQRRRTDATRLLTLVISLLAYFATGAQIPARANTDLFRAIDRHDFETLIQIRDNGGLANEESALAGAILASMLGADSEAEQMLAALLEREPEPAIRARALRSLSGVYVRLGLYDKAAAAMAEIRGMTDSDGVSIDDQSFAFFSALAPVGPMKIDYARGGEISARRDSVGLLRAPLTVNGETDDAVFDTGAAFSTVSVSMANRMRMRPLGASVEVGGSTEHTVSSGIAIAEEVRIGEIIFHNVPFIVIPDENLSFPVQNYSISSIIGLPLIRAMERIEWRISEDGGTMRHSRSQGSAEPGVANMITSGWQHVVLARINDSPSRMRLFLDTGANSTDFYENLLEIAPDLLDAAETATSRRAGVGGVTEEQELPLAPSYKITIGDATISAGPTDVLPDDGSFRHGVLGLDILTRFDLIEMDFRAMTFRPSGPMNE
ncbi:MAG: hypothetical protein Tsb0010_09950 [Parvularculaceae bacterium]